MLKQRVITASALGLPALALIAWGPAWAVLILVAATLGLAAWEWGVLAGLRGAAMLVPWTVLAVAGIALPTLAGSEHLELTGVILGVALWAAAAFALPFYHADTASEAVWRPLLRASGLLMVVAAGVSILVLHRIEPLLVVYLIVLIGLADTGAYFAGRRFGRTALAPEISPGKTREGLMGGMGLVFVFAVIVAGAADLDPMDALPFVLLSMVTGLISVVGDLFESILKRRAGAKDSGSLLPGHGGILDRVDSHLAAAPVLAGGLYWLQLWPVPAA